MQIVIHRVNTLDKLAKVKAGHGIEIDIRGHGDKMLLAHDPISSLNGLIDLDTLLVQALKSGINFFIFNTKEAGYEQRIIDTATALGIKKEKYFLLDVEFPYIYHATRVLGVRQIAIRYSEAEPIEAVEAQMIGGTPLLDWVFIDTNTKLPLDENIVSRLKPFKTALVCPERWGRKHEIANYANRMKQLGFSLDLVMTPLDCAPIWEEEMK